MAPSFRFSNRNFEYVFPFTPCVLHFQFTPVSFVIYLTFLTIQFGEGKIYEFLVQFILCHIFLLRPNILVRALSSNTSYLWTPTTITNENILTLRRSNFLSSDVFSSGFVNKVCIKFSSANWSVTD